MNTTILAEIVLFLLFFLLGWLSSQYILVGKIKKLTDKFQSDREALSKLSDTNYTDGFDEGYSAGLEDSIDNMRDFVNTQERQLARVKTKSL